MNVERQLPLQQKLIFETNNLFNRSNYCESIEIKTIIEIFFYITNAN
jgi:hypothetical protein